MDLSSSQTSNIFDFATEQGRSIVYLHYVDLAICGLILVIVTGLLTYVAIKFRRKSGDAEPKQYTGNLKLEITWTVIPLLLLLFLGVLTAIVMNRVNPPVLERKPDVVINAHQWWWEYRYPKTGVVTANELFLPEGVDSLIEVRAADVVHSFWVPDFGQKMDAIPGHPNFVFYKPIRQGIFTGSCSEFCGEDHALMRIFAKVVSPEDFEKWTQEQLKVPAAPQDDGAKNGEKLFMAKTCIQCHTINGTSAKGQVGPDLTHVAQRQTLGSALIANSTENLSAWIMNPQKFKPGCHMPDMRMSKNDARAIAVYLESLK